MSSRKKVLIVDDEPTILEFIRAILENAGYQHCSCENGTDVLPKIEKEKPDLILLDVMLPDMDGVTICRRIRSNPGTKHIPVIMVTSLTDMATVHDAHLFGATDYISKPFDENSLKSKIEKIFNKKSSM